MPAVHPHTTFRFGAFELDLAAYTLQRRGRAVRLERRPMDLLILLVKQQGQLVPRADIARQLWGDGAFGDVEMGINTAILKVRRALHDSPRKPLFIETVPGRGYRFIGELVIVDDKPLVPRLKLAVLPFENLAGDPELDHVVDGLTEEVIALLGQLGADRLDVIGRTSVMVYKRTKKSLAVIGRELNATYLVESSVNADGAQLRITSRLIRAADQVQVWSASYERQPTSMLEFQRELSLAIAEQILPRLSADRLNRLTRRQTRDSEAYDLYLRGRHLWNQLSPPTTRRAIEYYSRATELDSGYALAWSGLADAYAASPINGDAPPNAVWQRARDAAQLAVAAEPDLAEAHASVAFVKFWLDWDWAGAETTFRKAIALDPNYAVAHRTLGIVLSCMQRHEEAERTVRRARELDPLHAGSYALSAQVAFYARDYPAAIQLARQATLLDPEFWVGYIQLAQAYERSGDNDLAFDALQKAGMFGGDNSKVISLRGFLLAKLGRTDEASEVLNMLESASQHRYLPPYATALVHCGLGQCDLAFDWLERAFKARDVHLALLPVDPKWDRLRADHRFPMLVKRCGFNRIDISPPLKIAKPD
jgi:TolB-like protein/DNA-binding winged helix-turn-helix (wHTH) protein/Flp pilus assembly protein TadD